MFKRLCTAGEFQFYFSSLLRSGSGNLKLNKNCNLSTWLSGCQPGWACSVGGQTIDLQNYDDVPDRTNDCQPCCEGFFCPHGLTCMMRKSSHVYKLNTFCTYVIQFTHLLIACASLANISHNFSLFFLQCHQCLICYLPIYFLKVVI